MNIENAQKQVDDWIKTHGVRYFNELNKHGAINRRSW